MFVLESFIKSIAQYDYYIIANVIDKFALESFRDFSMVRLFITKLSQYDYYIITDVIGKFVLQSFRDFSLDE